MIFKDSMLLGHLRWPRGARKILIGRSQSFNIRTKENYEGCVKNILQEEKSC
jgi:hypothetical protein